MVYSRARQLFRTELPGVGWPCADGDLAMVRLRVRYLARAELELLAEGSIRR